MHFVAVLNRGGGTLRSLDIDAFAARVEQTLGAAGHSVDMRVVDGADLVDELAAAARDPRADVVLAGGGDGTISAAAAALMDGDKALAVLPAGTMNLFARSLAIPLDLDQAVQGFACGTVRAVDIATANGRPFVHQFSVGLHAKMVKLRDEMDFGSRLGKMVASLRAALATLVRPPSMRIDLELEGAAVQMRTASIGVSNNLFGERQLLPYAERPNGGTLGIYVTSARSPRELVMFAANMLVGRWRRNPKVVIRTATEATIHFHRLRARHRCAIDGELVKLESPTVFRIHPGALKVLVPG